MAKKKSLPVATGPIAYKPSKADIERERGYRAESAIRTLKEADSIKKDKALMRDCKAYAKQQAKIVDKM